MIKEILEKNKVHLHSMSYDNQYGLELYDIAIGGYVYIIPHSQINDTETKTIETACRDFVKVYGFKLSWLDNNILNMIKGLKSLHLDEWLHNWTFIDVLDYEDKQLICWLYANDIKIINDIKEI